MIVQQGHQIMNTINRSFDQQEVQGKIDNLIMELTHLKD